MRRQKFVHLIIEISLAPIMLISLASVAYPHPDAGQWTGSGVCHDDGGRYSVTLSVDDTGFVTGRIGNSSMTGLLTGKSISLSGPGTKAIGTLSGSHMSGNFPTSIGHGSTCSWEATLVAPSHGNVKPSDHVNNKSFCDLSLGKVYDVCAGSNGQCACVTFRNNCPYPVTAIVRLSELKGNGLRSTSVRPGDVERICATHKGQQVEYMGWKPWMGYPKKGQPRPKGD
jgi:hypothetical protein